MVHQIRLLSGKNTYLKNCCDHTIKYFSQTIVIVIFSLIASGCSGGFNSSDGSASSSSGLVQSSSSSGAGGSATVAEINLWTWLSGSTTRRQVGVYGVQGVPNGANVPGARYQSSTWIDGSNNLWIFGGNAGAAGTQNDLWRWDGVNWTWISGNSVGDQPGVYGVRGVAAGGNIPGSRYMSLSWIDSGGDFWIFGGYGFDSGWFFGQLNDLWRWDGVNWTWISGSDTMDAISVHGVQGVANGANIPSGRYGSVSWVDGADNLWLFGGTGRDSGGTSGVLNDLWRWDGVNWTWVSGSNVVNQIGTYGVQGVADGSNIPGARNYMMSGVDSGGNFWLSGGLGYDSAGNYGFLNDLWKWDGVNWTWVSGSNVRNQFGNYGVQGVAAGTNIPGGRRQSTLWIDISDNIWLFGGEGYDSVGATGNINDFWKWDGVNWTWVSGSDVISQIGVYGVQGVAAGTNTPGAREGGMSWVDTSGNLWFFGGDGYDSVGAFGTLNDLWKYEP